MGVERSTGLGCLQDYHNRPSAAARDGIHNERDTMQIGTGNPPSFPRRREPKYVTIIAGATLMWLAFGSASAATVEVHVANVAAGKGKVNVAVCDREHFLKQCVYSASAPAQTNAAGETVVRVQGVPPGTWAVLAYQDANSNNELDRLLGIPRENYGFSRDARSHFGPPSFDDAAVPVTEPATVATFKLQ
jgi:uncharacterized protein (DUF2141 family)